jgi:hypothetical protein
VLRTSFAGRLSLAGIFVLGLIFPASPLCRAQADPNAKLDPASVLRSAMMAACSQNSTNFAQALTTRNADAFTHLTPAARATLLKRFVLLDKSGDPKSSVDASGNSVIRCATPDLTTEMTIGKAEIRDNLAYLPLTVQDAADAAGDSIHQIVIGMVRENGQWKLLSLGLLMLDLPTLGEEWDRAEIKVNEQAAINDLKKLVDAVETYRKTYTRLPESISMLGPAPQGQAKSDKAGLIDHDLAAGQKDGYMFRYVIVGANTSGAPAKYEIAVMPTEYARSGLRSFFYDLNGAMHAADHHGAVGSSADPKLE